MTEDQGIYCGNILRNDRIRSYAILKLISPYWLSVAEAGNKIYSLLSYLGHVRRKSRILDARYSWSQESRSIFMAPGNVKRSSIVRAGKLTTSYLGHCQQFTSLANVQTFIFAFLSALPCRDKHFFCSYSIICVFP